MIGIGFLDGYQFLRFTVYTVVFDIFNKTFPVVCIKSKPENLGSKLLET